MFHRHFFLKTAFFSLETGANKKKLKKFKKIKGVAAPEN